jgi:hypothetical protein
LSVHSTQTGRLQATGWRTTDPGTEEINVTCITTVLPSFWVQVITRESTRKRKGEENPESCLNMQPGVMRPWVSLVSSRHRKEQNSNVIFSAPLCSRWIPDFHLDIVFQAPRYSYVCSHYYWVVSGVLALSCPSHRCCTGSSPLQMTGRVALQVGVCSPHFVLEHQVWKFVVISIISWFKAKEMWHKVTYLPSTMDIKGEVSYHKTRATRSMERWMNFLSLPPDPESLPSQGGSISIILDCRPTTHLPRGFSSVASCPLLPSSHSSNQHTLQLTSSE